MIDNEKIFAMKAGKELDNTVAREVMGGVAANYSEDISTAWKVVKKLETMNWRIYVISSKQGETVDAVKIVHGKPISLNYLAGVVESDSLAEAICKAALLIHNNSQRIGDMESNSET